ncbi:MAG: TIGR04255 family protein [Gammaproteobacteria bacterium]|nr:TIGR04255 family protein [Gammaproteobacteria bacterium]MCY4274396.1 TIGR04255 family protein [Gammaproteobacteria bacterium]
MSDRKLPKSLEKEPLIESLFEIRFSSDMPTSDVLAGILYSKLDGHKHIEKLPANEIPTIIRQNDPNLQFAFLVKLQLEGYDVLIGDKNAAVSCNMPYQGWSPFRSKIRQIIGIINEAGIVKSIHRYSLKYVDLLEMDASRKYIDLLESTISIGQYKLEGQDFSLKVEISHEEFLNIVNILSLAQLIVNNNVVKEGVIIDIDTIFMMPESSDIDDWPQYVSEGLESIHAENKRLFFNLLKEETIASLNPKYDV